MPRTSIDQLPRREREVFETLYRLEQATTAPLRGVLADPLSDSAVRTLLSRLEAKGLVRRTAGPDGFVYAPVPRTDAVAEGALKRMVETFFAGSAASAATAISVIRSGGLATSIQIAFSVVVSGGCKAANWLSIRLAGM